MAAITLSTDKSKLSIEYIHRFLTGTYWAKGRTMRQVEKTIEHSLCFGIYADDKQIGFARVATDQAIFAYLMDVFIDEEHRGQGYGKQLVEYVLSDPRLASVERWMLGTFDAAGLYVQYGFTPLAKPHTFMEKVKSK